MEDFTLEKEETITITKKEYFNLRLRDETLAFLEVFAAEAYGVDNWQGWGDCFSPEWPDDAETLEEVEEKLRKEILGDK